MLIIYNGKPIIGQPYAGGAMVYPTICFSSYDEEMYGHKHGIFSGHRPYDFIFPVFLIQVILAFVMSKLVYYSLRHLIRSKPVCYILGGIILGPSFLGQSETYMDIVFPEKEMLIFNTMVKIGIAYYIFITAVKMDAAMSLRTSKTTWIISICCFINRIAINGYFGAKILPNIVGVVHGTGPSIISDELSISFFIVVADAMKEHNLLTSELGQLAMSCAMLIEMICWVLIIATAVLLQLSCLDAIRVVLVIVALALFGIYVLRPAIIKIIETTPKGDPVNENYILAMLLAALIMGMVTDLLCGSLFPGALIMGLIIPDGPPLGAALVEKAELMVNEFFMPFFFVMIGYHVNVYSIFLMQGFSLLLILIGVSHIATFVGTMVGSLFCDIKLRNAALLSMILNFKGFLDFATYEKWYTQKVYNDGVYTTLVLSSLILTIVYNIILYFFYKPQIRLGHSTPQPKRFTTLQSASHTKQLQILTCVHSEDNVRGIITIFKAANPTTASPILVHVIHAIDLVGRAAPLLTPYSNNKKKMKRIQPNSTDYIMRAFTNYSSTSPVSIRPFTMIAPYGTMHNIICHHARDKQIPFIIVPWQGNQEANSVQSNLVRDFNIQLQLNALCTVGILVDRGLNEGHADHMSSNIAIIFVGGADDREALALALRMSSNPDVSITLLRIKVNKDEEQINETENRVDELLIQDFKDKNSDNACFVYREVVANDSLQLLAVIRCLEHDYDLVMVGKMPIKALFVEEMRVWVEHPELGLIGDVLASSDFCNGKMSVLVLQRYVEVNESSAQPLSTRVSISL